MRSRMCLACGLVLAPLLASELLAQWNVSVGPQRQVNPEGHRWHECSVAARLGDGNEAVVAATATYPASGLGYGVTLDGGASFQTDTIQGMGMDPGVTVDPVTDWIWISCMGGCVFPDKCVTVLWKKPGDWTVSGQCQALNLGALYILDKPLLTIAPNGWHHLFYMRFDRTDSCGDPPQRAQKAVWTAYSDAPAPEPCPDWPIVRVKPDPPHEGGCRWEGWGASPVVLSNNRVVVVIRDHDPVPRSVGSTTTTCLTSCTPTMMA